MFTAGALSRAKHFQILSLISSNFGDTGLFSVENFESGKAFSDCCCFELIEWHFV